MLVAALFVVVTPRLSGYAATSQCPEIIAMGSTAVVAAENALLAARALLDPALLPATIIIRLAEPGCITISIQAIDKPIRLEQVAVRPPSVPGNEAI
jgi:hypothetical protein